jgi:heme iron utilization protein
MSDQPPPATGDAGAFERVRDLLTGQPFGVLCTQGSGQPYGSLVAFAFTPDVRRMVFATPVATWKYRLLAECEHVALVVDDRSRHADELMAVSAVTITGRAMEVTSDEQAAAWAGLLIERHPYLRDFVDSPSTALFRVDVIRCVHVSRFGEVRRWAPPPLE